MKGVPLAAGLPLLGQKAAIIDMGLPISEFNSTNMV
jgi:hypothetical protein